MGTGVCLKGTKIYPLSTARLFYFNDVYLNWNAFVIYNKIKYFCVRLIYYFNITFCTETNILCTKNDSM